MKILEALKTVTLACNLVLHRTIIFKSA